MIERRKPILVENTRFYASRNFAGDPEKDKYGSDKMRGCIILPNDLALRMIDDEYNVKETKPKEGEEEGFQPEYFVQILVSYEGKWPPKIYFVDDETGRPTLLDEETVRMELDYVSVSNVDVMLNPYYSEKNDCWSLYVKNMFVTIRDESDPLSKKYGIKKYQRTEE